MMVLKTWNLEPGTPMRRFIAAIIIIIITVLLFLYPFSLFMYRTYVCVYRAYPSSLDPLHPLLIRAWYLQPSAIYNKLTFLPPPQKRHHTTAALPIDHPPSMLCQMVPSYATCSMGGCRGGFSLPPCIPAQHASHRSHHHHHHHPATSRWTCAFVVPATHVRRWTSSSPTDPLGRRRSLFRRPPTV
jgi:hypothetical protein